ncbi:hypothetical protein ACWDFL_37260 [Streptomyces bungoensis]
MLVSIRVAEELGAAAATAPSSKNCYATIRWCCSWRTCPRGLLQTGPRVVEAVFSLVHRDDTDVDHTALHRVDHPELPSKSER